MKSSIVPSATEEKRAAMLVRRVHMGIHSLRTMNPITIHTFVKAVHRDETIELWKTVFGYATAHNDPGLAIDKKVAIEDGLFFVALAEERVVGTIMAGYDGHRGWLYSLAVAATHRLQGTGTQLVRHAERALARRGCLKINLQILEENEAVASFYTTLGYSIEKRISMGKPLRENIPSV